jgi:hypothetical protein
MNKKSWRYINAWRLEGYNIYSNKMRILHAISRNARHWARSPTTVSSFRAFARFPYHLLIMRSVEWENQAISLIYNISGGSVRKKSEAKNMADFRRKWSQIMTTLVLNSDNNYHWPTAILTFLQAFLPPGFARYIFINFVKKETLF